MAELLNLNHARKAKRAAEEKRRAVENRAVHGRTKAEKAANAASAAQHAAVLDGARRGPPAD